jgi:hypothetical protein
MKTEKDFKVTLENGNKITVYSSSLRGTVISSHDCNTEYEETKKGSSIYKKVKSK